MLKASVKWGGKKKCNTGIKMKELLLKTTIKSGSLVTKCKELRGGSRFSHKTASCALVKTFKVLWIFIVISFIVPIKYLYSNKVNGLSCFTHLISTVLSDFVSNA